MKDKRFIFGEEAQRLTLHKMKEEKKVLYSKQKLNLQTIKYNNNEKTKQQQKSTRFF